MTAAHLHLLVNHAPLWGTFIGAMLLLASLWRPAPAWKDAGLWTLALTGVATFFVYMTGDPAAETLGPVDAATQQAVEAHRDASRFAFGGLTALTAASLAAALLPPRDERGHIPGRYVVAVLVVALACFAILGWVGHQGGLIQHVRLR